MTSGIYIIRNVTNGKVYVGSAVNVAKRWSQHRRALVHGWHANMHLQRAWKLYGHQMFEFVLMEEVVDPHALIIREQHWLDYFHAADLEFGYNIAPVAGSQLGLRRSEDTRAKMSAAAKRHSAERAVTCGQMAASRKGVPHSAEHSAHISEALKGKRCGPPHSEETRAKMSASHTGNPCYQDVERNAKISAALKGHKHSDETRAKLREAAQRREARKRAERENLALQEKE